MSLQELGKLVGYRLRPGVAAETWLAFALDTPPAPPATLAPEPGNFVTGVPATLRLDAGLKVQSVPGPDEKPQTFELVETLEDARAAWNAAVPWLGEPHVAGLRRPRGMAGRHRHRAQAGRCAAASSGQEFLADPTSDRWDFRLVSRSSPMRTTIARASPGRAASAPSIRSPSPSGQPSVYALRKRAGVFGNNAPIWRSMNADFREAIVARFGGTANQSEWQNFEISETAATASGGAVDLDGLQAEIAADDATDPARRSFAVLAKGGFNRPDENFPSGTYVELYRVTGTTEVSRAEFAISAKVTRLALEGENLDIFFDRVRQTSVFAKCRAAAPGRAAGRPQRSAATASPSRAETDGPAARPPADRARRPRGRRRRR